MKGIAILLVVSLLATLVSCQMQGSSCTHTGTLAQDNANCGVDTNNMYCGTSGTCVCADVYGASTAHYTIASDNMSCVKS
jgi:hypothetical protein